MDKKWVIKWASPLNGQAPIQTLSIQTLPIQELAHSNLAHSNLAGVGWGGVGWDVLGFLLGATRRPFTLYMFLKRGLMSSTQMPFYECVCLQVLASRLGNNNNK